MKKYLASIFLAGPGVVLSFVTGWLDLLRSSALMRSDLSVGLSNAALAIAAFLCVVIALVGEDWSKEYKSSWAWNCMIIFIVLIALCLGFRIFLSWPQTRFWQETVVWVWDLCSVALAISAILMITFASMSFHSNSSLQSRK